MLRTHPPQPLAPSSITDTIAWGLAHVDDVPMFEDLARLFPGGRASIIFALEGLTLFHRWKRR